MIKISCTEQQEKELRRVLDEITETLSQMTVEERLAWFRQTSYPRKVNFRAELDGTIYTVKTHFNDSANETIEQKAERVVLNSV